jgi:hypothetical protein
MCHTEVICLYPHKVIKKFIDILVLFETRVINSIIELLVMVFKKWIYFLILLTFLQ